MITLCAVSGDQGIATPISLRRPSAAPDREGGPGATLGAIDTCSGGLPGAEDISRARHPAGTLSTVPAELFDGLDHHRLLMAWIKDEV